MGFVHCIEHRFVVDDKTPLAVPHRAVDAGEALGPHAGALRIKFEGHPTVFVAPAFVQRQGRALLEVWCGVAVGGGPRQQAGLDQDLESVANADDGAAVRDKVTQRFAKREAQAVAKEAPAAEMVAEGCLLYTSPSPRDS